MAQDYHILFLLTITFSIGVANHYKPTGSKIVTTGVTSDQITHILDAHNTFRSTVASGLFSTYPQATNMKLLQWDRFLAHKAQMWANMASGVPSPNSFREQSPWGIIGQNIFVQTFSSKDASKNAHELLVTNGIQSWIGESMHYNVSELPNYVKNENASQFTQLIWAMTSRVGCGITTYEIDGDYVGFLVCFYGRPANLVENSVYNVVNQTAGENPCSFCGGTTCSSNYAGLCNCYLNDTIQCLLKQETEIIPVTHTFRITNRVATFTNGRLQRSTQECYSGYKEAANDISKQYIRALGPLPHGRYDIIEMLDQWKMYPNSAVLMNTPDTDTQGRGDFLIHGDNPQHDHSESIGCVVVPQEFRLQIFANDTLAVIYD